MNFFATRKKTLLFAFITWLIPLSVSFTIYPLNAEFLSPSFLFFKTAMFLILTVVTFFCFKRLKNNDLLSIAEPNLFLTVNCILDLAVLSGLFQMPVAIWFLTILPFYLIVFYGLYFLLKKH